MIPRWAATRSRSVGKALSVLVAPLLGLSVCVRRIRLQRCHRFTRDAVALERPVAEVCHLAALRAERTVRISIPADRPAARGTGSWTPLRPGSCESEDRC